MLAIKEGVTGKLMLNLSGTFGKSLVKEMGHKI